MELTSYLWYKYLSRFWMRVRDTWQGSFLVVLIVFNEVVVVVRLGGYKESAMVATPVIRNNYRVENYLRSEQFLYWASELMSVRTHWISLLLHDHSTTDSTSLHLKVQEIVPLFFKITGWASLELTFMSHWEALLCNTEKQEHPSSHV